MALYHLKQTEIVKVEKTSFEESRIRERQDLQVVLRDNFNVISELFPKNLVIGKIAEEG